MSVGKRIAVNTGFLYARMAITVFISLYATRLILKALGAEDFGIFNVVGGAIAMLGFLNTSMAAATQRFMSYSQGEGKMERLRQIFNVSVVLHLIIAAILIIVLEIAGYFFFHGILNISPHRLYSAKLIYQFMVVSTMFTIISVPYDAAINAHENMLLFAILGILESLLKLSIALYITFTKSDKLIFYGLLTALLSVVLLIIRRIYCVKKYPECTLEVKKYFSKPVFKEMSGFAGWSFLGTSSSIIANYGQGIIINIFFGTIVNAAQGIANQVSGQLGAFAVTMLNALNPTIAKSEGAGDRSLMIKTSMIGSKISFFLLIFFYVPVLIEMPYIFKIWLKNVPDYAVIFCRLLLIRNLIQQLFITLSSVISAVGNIKKYQIYTSVLSFFPLIVCYVLFKMHYPAYTLYIVFIVYSSIISSYTLYFASKNSGLSVSFFLKENVLKCLTVFVLMMLVSAVPFLMLHEGFSRFLLVATVSTVSFFLFVCIIGFNSSELAGFKRIGSSLFTTKFKKRFHLVS